MFKMVIKLIIKIEIDKITVYIICLPCQYKKIKIIKQKIINKKHFLKILLKFI